MIKNETSHASLKENFDIENPEVYIETVSDDVQVMESTDGKCHVEITAKSETSTPLDQLVEINVSGRKLSVHAFHKKKGFLEFLKYGSIDLLVVVKIPQTAELKIKTVSGDLEVAPAVTKVDVTTVSGDIAILRNPFGVCDLKTVSGDITTHTFSSCEYKLKSVSGDIRVHIAPGLDIEVDGKTISGDLESEISLDSMSDSHSEGTESVTITATTVSGDFILARN